MVGSTRVPMFSITASWPASNSGTSGASCGASAYWRASGKGFTGLRSAVAASASSGVAIAGRCSR